MAEGSRPGKAADVRGENVLQLVFQGEKGQFVGRFDRRRDYVSPALPDLATQNENCHLLL